ncbi:transposase [Wolbachia endosymbiont of Armadillidium arcangelii]|uniref:transposase n=1 Tax=Wolbachia endosymbiont of Armadillidium arcangelii TaxID=3158571 RepID=UPI0012936014
MEDNKFYAYGWAKKGKRLFADKPGYKRRRVSIIGALNEGKTMDGYCNSEIFEAYIENRLVPI